jgi:adenylosuccinate lyase
MISPLDSIYSSRTTLSEKHFSDYSLVKTCYELEVAWLKACSEVFSFKFEAPEFSKASYDEIKLKEKACRHDIKAIEYHLADVVSEGAKYLHIFLTSEDIKNIAYRLMLKRFQEDLDVEISRNLIGKLGSIPNLDTPLLARTHAQVAVPTTFTKEIAVFAYRIGGASFVVTPQIKLGGAIGNWNSAVLLIGVDKLQDIIAHFMLSLNIDFEMPCSLLEYSTQVNSNVDLFEVFQNYRHLSLVLEDFCNDIWYYCLLDYINIAENADYVGSSTMPQKKNPINFENAIGNLQLSRAILNTISDNICISKLQRDLSGSTLHRNIGVGMAHLELAISSIIDGIGKIVINTEKIKSDLDSKYECLLEALQTALRLSGNYSYGENNSYKEIAASAHQNMSFQDWIQLLDKYKFDLDTEYLKILLDTKPSEYIGVNCGKINMHQTVMIKMRSIVNERKTSHNPGA